MVTLIVKVSVAPSRGFGLATVLWMDTFAAGCGELVADEECCLPVGSGVVWVSVAVLTIVPEWACTVTTSWRLTV